MKKFMRTLTGKTTAFLVCLLSTLILALSILGACLFMDNDLQFYTRSEESVRDELVVRNQLFPWGYNQLFSSLQQSSHEDDGNLYQITDQNGSVIYVSPQAEADQQWQYEIEYGAILKDGQVIDIFDYQDRFHYDNSESAQLYTVRMSLTPQFRKYAEVQTYEKLVHIAYGLRYWIFVIALLAGILTVASYVGLLSASGRQADSEQLSPGKLDIIPFDVMLGGGLLLGIMGAYWADGYDRLNDSSLIVILAVTAVIGLAVFLGLNMIAASRIKRGVFLKNNVIYMLAALMFKAVKWFINKCLKLLRFIMNIIRGLPLIVKTVIAVGALSLLEFIVLISAAGDRSTQAMLFIMEKMIIVPFILYFALCLKRLQKGAQALAAGDLSHHTDTKGLFLDLKTSALDLNNIALGMSKAVEEQMKSERMKTELITNVSHDIKTPLTSIINYADLIGKENCDNEKIKEYSEVLLRQSEKLKRLIDDLVEASKASTGNLEVSLMPCDANVFIAQAAGEYEEKLAQADLTLITRQPEGEVRIMADGRRMWRIFDNLMNNICKYAQPSTRVYLTLEEQGDKAVITFKNTSREKLDISEEELMERFTRGDSSRNTEGNGLGLAIARSMAELQKGSLNLVIDGDLFKAILTFPRI